MFSLHSSTKCHLCQCALADILIVRLVRPYIATDHSITTEKKVLSYLKKAAHAQVAISATNESGQQV